MIRLSARHFASSSSSSQREHRPRISRILLDPDQLPDSQVDLPASVSECADGDRGLVLADLSIPDAHKLFVPLRYGLRLPRGRIGVPVAPRDGIEHSKMERTGDSAAGAPATAPSDWCQTADAAPTALAAAAAALVAGSESQAAAAPRAQTAVPSIQASREAGWPESSATPWDQVPDAARSRCDPCRTEYSYWAGAKVSASPAAAPGK